MNDEMRSLHKRRLGANGCMQRREFPNREDVRHKVRLVVKGYAQMEGFDYSEFFSPMLGRENLQDSANDIGLLERNLGLQLKKSLYSLKQSPRQWYKRFDQCMGHGFTRPDISKHRHFCLARLYDHGQLSHTTNVVGTVGYIALELARTGKASTRTDVYAYGVLLLEVATGKRPLESDNFILVDWVLEFQQLGQILDVVDPKLGSDYAVEEMELMLGLGLLCCHHIPEARPTMRQVLRYLNGDDLLPLINWSSVNSQRSEMSSGFLEINSKDYSHISSSMGVISATSLDAAGR
ncbi:lectin-domain containing receptor kinase VI.4-like [Pistacia vera]|uniref:lectin-domain containing receptor kinase VI.4-like n=1 Tax=Pistacia vera TaxID=55513 RepID=UPI001262E047|nr:lectin-domain containing receptor kinase VI.4-like [Pistacia vera]